MTFGKFRTFQLASIYSHLRDFQVLGLGLALGKHSSSFFELTLNSFLFEDGDLRTCFFPRF